MDEFMILGTLSRVINDQVTTQMNEWIDKKPMNFDLLYPLVNIELGAMSEPPENIGNLFRRSIATFVYSKALQHGKQIRLRKFNVPGFKKFQLSYDEFLTPMYQNYRFARDINDINPFSKARLEEVGDRKYKVTTSLVSNKYSEEHFYFLGIDDEEKNRKELEQHTKLHEAFWNKIIIDKADVQKLKKECDQALYQLCIQIVLKDLNKWGGGVKSNVFRNENQLAKVIGYFYYHAMIHSIATRILSGPSFENLEAAGECIIEFQRSNCILDVASVSGIDKNSVEKIVQYLTNDGRMNLLEFPLFEVDNYLISIPSAFLVNDWQFTIINGHYIKGIDILRREKTISTITEKRIHEILSSVGNVYESYTKPYSYINSLGEKTDSDIDYAIYDITRNKLLIIEAKWIDKHYKDEIDKINGNILRTFNHIFNKQIPKHQEYLQTFDGINSIFEMDSRYQQPAVMPEIYYLAVDKRNQLHIDGKHMITEFMLIAFLKKCITDNQINLEAFWKVIEPLTSTVEYITISNQYHEIVLDSVDAIVLVEESDLEWNAE